MTPRERAGIKMNQAKQKRKKGWRVGSVAELLALTPDESAYIEMKIALSQSVRARRADKRLTQMQLARLLKSSQSRVAKIEAGDKSVSLDLLVRSLVILGASRRDLAQVIAG
jgi:DNA-binding XRE family transcriptional regulator